jgi:uncharacterized protein (DUF2147 family)
MTKTLFFITLFLSVTTPLGADPGSIFGVWNTDKHDAKLEFFSCGDKVCGKIIWVKEPKYIHEKDGPVGTTKTDRKNPDPALRNRPVLGLQIMQGLTPKGNNKWADGACYDPETGKTYKCKMQLTSSGKLKMRGYIGISLIGRTMVMTR